MIQADGVNTLSEQEASEFRVITGSLSADADFAIACGFPNNT
jgi:hypothetical protein